MYLRGLLGEGVGLVLSIPSDTLLALPNSFNTFGYQILICEMHKSDCF